MPVKAPFRPLPFLGNPHVQTVLAHLTGFIRKLPADMTLVPLPDGDAVALHESRPVDWTEGGDCVLLVHGLSGSSRSPYVMRVARRLVRRGFRVYRIDLRGAGDAANHCDKLYNAAGSGDIRAAAHAIHAANPGSRLFVAGFSLGGNLALKMAGEAGEHPVPGLAGVASVAAPIDLMRCSELITSIPFYDRFYVKGLVQQVTWHERRRPHLTPTVWPRAMKSLRVFDDVYTAPRGGFDGVFDYYTKAAPAPIIPRISVPTFLLTSRDDPFVWAPAYEQLPNRPGQKIVIAEGGGHLGFLGPDGQGGLRWAETQVINWLVRQ